MRRRTVEVMTLRRAVPVLVAACALAACGSGDDSSSSASSTSSTTAYAPAIDPATFTTSITNEWFPLAPGTVFVYDGEEDGEKQHNEVTVTHDTKVVDGVTCVVVHDVVFIAGKVREDTYDWYAQAADGAVWYFGEDTKELHADGSVSSREGSWESGKDGAQPGIIMTAHPTVGQHYRQEYRKGEAEDMATVTETGATATAPAGSYDDVLVVEETSRLEPDLREEKRYASGVGFVSSDTLKGGDEKWALVRIEHS